MTQNQGSEPVPASRTGQLISARDMAMQKFEEGMLSEDNKVVHKALKL
ncbi:hypothetical protein [Escherichia coli]|nr:hypothetical protein [Escherichia coli]